MIGPDRRRSSRDGFLLSASIYVPLSLIALALWPEWQSMSRFPLGGARLLLFGLAQTIGLLAAYVLGTFAAPHLTWRSLAIAWLLFIGGAFAALGPKPFAAMLEGPLLLFLVIAGAINLCGLAWIRARNIG